MPNEDTKIYEDKFIRVSLKVFVSIILFLISGMWVTAMTYSSLRQEISDLKKIDYWTRTDMTLYSYELRANNPNLMVPSPKDIRRNAEK